METVPGSTGSPCRRHLSVAREPTSRVDARAPGPRVRRDLDAYRYALESAGYESRLGTLCRG